MYENVHGQIYKRTQFSVGYFDHDNIELKIIFLRFLFIENQFSEFLHSENIKTLLTYKVLFDKNAKSEVRFLTNFVRKLSFHTSALYCSHYIAVTD